MKAMTLKTIADVTNATLVVHGENVDEQQSIISVSTDSREQMSGQVFVALVGEKFDGHDFVKQAETNGASAIVVSRDMSVNIPQLVVDDTLEALAAIGRYQRLKYQIPTIGLTGSCGKTTTKEMIVSILGQSAQVHATRGNLNNQFGVPFTLFELQDSDELSVLEMGAGHPGDIDFLTNIALPDVVLITCIAEAHLEGMGSLEGIAATKGEIIHGLSENGTAVLPLEEKWLDDWRKKLSANQKLLTFGLNSDADVYATNISLWSQGMKFTMHYDNDAIDVRLPLLGEHNVQNALAASACAIAVGYTLNQCANGLEMVTSTAGRLTQIPGLDGSQIIDDTYNANPKAMLAAASVLQQYPGQHVMIVGDMAELGPESVSIHHALGQDLKVYAIDQLLTVGTLSAYTTEGFGANARHFDSKDSLIEFIQPQLNSDLVVLVKGSRSAGMEEVVQRLTDLGDAVNDSGADINNGNREVQSC